MIDRAVLLTHNLSKSEAQNIRKYENLALKIENVWKLNNISTQTLVITEEVMVNKPF
jgi:hypothetical protein